MKPADFLKAAIAAVAILAINVALAFGVVAVYSYAIEPGHDSAFYERAAERIAPWSSVVFGALLFYLFARMLGRRRPERSALAFALVMFAIYAAIDLSVLVAASAFPQYAVVIAVSLATKLATAILGARAARR